MTISTIKDYSHRYTNFPIGTTKEQEVVAAAMCCVEGLRLRVTDVSGNVAEAHAIWDGTNPKLSTTAIAAILIAVILTMAGTIVLTYFARKNGKYCFVSQSPHNNTTPKTWPETLPMKDEVYYYKDNPSN